MISSHLKKWRGCTACPLHETRTRIVLFRGCCPAPVLFLGEAPGDSEDLRGEPFVGPAGKLFDQLIEPIEEHVEYGVSNVVCCVPHKYEEASITLRQPSKQEMAACQPRLLDLLQKVKPRIVVCLGKVAASYVSKLPNRNFEILELIHPSAILRMESVSSQNDAYQRFQVNLIDRLQKLKLCP